jgi:hypothetical protein
MSGEIELAGLHETRAKAIESIAAIRAKRSFIRSSCP